MTIEILLKNFATSLRTFSMTHALETECVINLRRGFNNERRRVIVELIGMSPNPAFVSFFKNKGKCIAKGLLGAQPHKFIGTGFD